MTETSKQGKNCHPFLTDTKTQNVAGFSFDCLDIDKQDKQPGQHSEPATFEQWKPDQIAGHRIGDVVRLAGGDSCQFEIVGINDPLVTLRSPTGREIRAGWRALKRVRRKGRGGRA